MSTAGDGSLLVATEPAGIADAFDSLGLIYQPEKARDFEFTPLTISEQGFQLSPKVSGTFNVISKGRLSKYQLDITGDTSRRIVRERYEMFVDFTVSGSVSGSKDASFSKTLGTPLSVNLGKLSIPTPLGVPIPVTLWGQLKLQAQGSFNGTCSANYSVRVYGPLGIEKDAGGEWKGYGSLNMDKDLSYTTAKGTMSLSLGPEMEIHARAFGTYGPYWGGSPVRLELSASAESNPRGNRARIGVSESGTVGIKGRWSSNLEFADLVVHKAEKPLSTLYSRFFPSEVDKVVVTPAQATVEVDGELPLVAQALDSDGNVIEDVQFSWSTSDSSRALVGSTGIVTGASEGTATITVKEASSQKQAVATVVVQPKRVNVNFYVQVGQEVVGEPLPTIVINGFITISIEDEPPVTRALVGQGWVILQDVFIRLSKGKHRVNVEWSTGTDNAYILVSPTALNQSLIPENLSPPSDFDIPASMAYQSDKYSAATFEITVP